MSESDDAGPPPLRRFADAAGLERLSGAGIAALAAIALVAAIAWGIAALALHDHYLALREAGHDLGPLPGLFADASTPITALSGWAAAICFALAARQMRHHEIEPPAGVGTVSSVAQLRAGLRREYRGVLVILAIVAAVAMLDLGRLLVSAVAGIASAPARTSLPLMTLEAAGLWVAALALVAWAAVFREHLLRLGALDGKPA